MEVNMLKLKSTKGNFLSTDLYSKELKIHKSEGVNPDKSIESTSLNKVDQFQLDKWFLNVCKKKRYLNNYGTKIFYNIKGQPLCVKGVCEGAAMVWDLKSGQFICKETGGSYAPFMWKTYFKLNKSIKSKTVQDLMPGIDLMDTTLRRLASGAGVSSYEKTKLDEDVASRYFLP